MRRVILILSTVFCFFLVLGLGIYLAIVYPNKLLLTPLFKIILANSGLDDLTFSIEHAEDGKIIFKNISLTNKTKHGLTISNMEIHYHRARLWHEHRIDSIAIGKVSIKAYLKKDNSLSLGPLDRFIPPSSDKPIILPDLPLLPFTEVTIKQLQGSVDYQATPLTLILNDLKITHTVRNEVLLSAMLEAKAQGLLVFGDAKLTSPQLNWQFQARYLAKPALEFTITKPSFTMLSWEYQSKPQKSMIIMSDEVTGVFANNNDHDGIILTGKKSNITDLSEPLWFSPFDCFYYITLDPKSIKARMELDQREQRYHLDLTTAYQIKPKRFEMNYTLDPITFAVGINEPHQLFPFLKDGFQTTSGEVSSSGEAWWQGDDHKADIILKLKEVSTTLGGVSVDRISGDIALTSLSPLATAPKQNITMKGVNAGLALTDGNISFGIEEGTHVHINQGRFTFEQGRVLIDPFVIDMSTISSDLFTIRTERLPLDHIATLVLQEDLTATGEVTGQLKAKLDHGTLRLEGGRLKSLKAGEFHYRPGGQSPFAGVNQQAVKMTSQALENFHYQTLDMKLVSDTPESKRIILSLLGSNPELFSGKPIKLTVTLKGNLDEILRNGLSFYKLPERIEEQLQQQGQQP